MMCFLVALLKSNKRMLILQGVGANARVLQSSACPLELRGVSWCSQAPADLHSYTQGHKPPDSGKTAKHTVHACTLSFAPKCTLAAVQGLSPAANTYDQIQCVRSPQAVHPKLLAAPYLYQPPHNHPHNVLCVFKVQAAMALHAHPLHCAWAVAWVLNTTRPAC